MASRATIVAANASVQATSAVWAYRQFTAEVADPRESGLRKRPGSPVLAGAAVAAFITAATQRPAVTDDETLTELADVLRETESYPVERGANRWLGEAEAVASDLAASDLPDDVLRERLGHVERLLSNVDGTGSAEADALVARARSLTEAAIEDE